jgi:WASH complex subunit 7, N-terminal
MNGLFKAKTKMMVELLKKNNVYFEIFDNLGSILTNLYTIDLIIMDNANFQNYWGQYQKMFLIAQNNPAKFGMTDRKVKKIKKFIVRCYENFLCGKLYTNYLEGLIKSISDDQVQHKFEPIQKNKEFQEMYREYLKQKVVKIDMLLNNPYDMVSHQEYLNLLMMYSLCRRLFEAKDQERDLYKAIWKLQRTCPIIIIYNNLKCIPGKFLM